MAELFGVATGVLSAASFAVQVLESVQKLRSVFQSVKDAPLELQELIEEIAVLSELAAQLVSNTSADVAEKHALDKSVVLFRKAIDRLDSILKELESQTRRARRRGPLLIVLKLEKCESLFRRLDRCRGMLHLAHQVYASAEQKRQQDRQETLLVELTNITMKEVAKPKIKGLLASAQRGIRTPSWAFSKVWQLNVDRAISGWTASLRYYRIVEDTDVVFRACWRDELDTIERLLATGEATVHDQDRQGRTLFQTAITYGSFEVAKFLHDHDAAQIGRLHCELSPFDCFWVTTLYKSTQSGQGQETFETLSNTSALFSKRLECIGLDIQDLDRYAPLLNHLAKPSGSRTFQSKIDMLIYAFESIMPCPGLVDNVLEEVLGLQALDQDLLRLRKTPQDFSFIHVLALGFATDLAAQFSEGQTSPTPAPFLLSKMKQAVAAKERLNHRSCKKDGFYFENSPLSVLILDFRATMAPEDTEDLLNRALRSWVSALAEAGVNLGAYGMREAAMACQLNFWYSKTRLRGFSYGPRPSDWWFWIENSNDHYAGMFWKLIEDPEKVVPGAWVELEDGDFGTV